MSIDIPQNKDPFGSTRVWFHCLMADGDRDYINSTSLWTGTGWSGPWTPTKPRAVPLPVRAAVEAALQRREMEA